jgi:glutathione synthase/RimK-type ligase-like ATP-grasp enzyme
MKKILILVNDRNKREAYLEPLLADFHNRTNSVKFATSSLEELNFTIDDDITIGDTSQNFTITEFDLVVFRKVGNFKNEATSLAYSLDARNIKYIDSVIKTLAAVDDENKLGEMIALKLAGIAVPKTAYGNNEFLISQAKIFGFPCIVKSVDGHKGQNNFLAHSETEIRKIFSQNSDTTFLVQEFIPNDEDYRILVLDNDRIVTTLRRRRTDTHLNNISAGGEEILITDFSNLEHIIEVARQATRALDIEVAGVDIVVDKNTNKAYVMEVNRAPQLTLQAEINAYYDMIVNMATNTEGSQ